MSEKNALLITSKKAGLLDLAHALDEADYQLVARGKAAEVLENESDLTVLSVPEFLGDIGSKDIEFLPEDSRREMLSAFLGQCLKLGPEDQGGPDTKKLPALDFAYVRLERAGSVERPHNPAEHYMKQDDNDVIINGAIGSLRGPRPAIMKPHQIPGIISILQADPEQLENRIVAGSLAGEALRYLSLYKNRAVHQLHYGSMTTPAFQPEDIRQ